MMKTQLLAPSQRIDTKHYECVTKESVKRLYTFNFVPVNRLSEVGGGTLKTTPKLYYLNTDLRIQPFSIE